MIKLTKPRSSRSLAITIATIAQSKLATDILILDLRKVDTAPADFFVICSTTNPIQTKSVFEEIYYKIKSLDVPLPRFEGLESLEWVVIDYFDVVVNIMSENARNYYKLEKLWSDAKFLALDEKSQIVNFDKENLKTMFLAPTIEEYND